uniref:Uncharacterized protein n=2 Tax=Janibacter limosus TaxID=53458 RepID=A0AC61U7A5_9MICO|nr:hypothetical protein [Janibacter limosus]
MTTLNFTPPSSTADATAAHHASAAIQNLDVVTQAIGALQDALDGHEPHERILLKAAAGAGKTFALKRMVVEALAHESCTRVGVTAFANKQVIPLAGQLGDQLGRERVCLSVSEAWFDRVPALGARQGNGRHQLQGHPGVGRGHHRDDPQARGIGTVHA